MGHSTAKASRDSTLSSKPETNTIMYHEPSNLFVGHAEHEESLQGRSDDDSTSTARYVPGSIAEERLLRKLDLRIIPCVWALYMLSYLDRANIGNAKTGGMAKDFDLTSEQYSVILLVFFVSYVIFEIPSNMILTRVRPSLYLSGIAVVWGVIAACMAATRNWQQLAGVRFALGIVEAGFAPGASFYLSSWYRRYEVTRRYSVYYTAVAVAGALSGLLAGVITEYLDGARGIAGWRWLFIIEGCGSILVGLVAWTIMADYPSTTRWLSDSEKSLAVQRLAYDGLGDTQGADSKIGELKALRMVISDWRSWVLALLYALVTGAQTIQYFIPTLVGSFGWTSWDGQYHSIPPYVCALVFILAFSFISDYFKEKALFLSLFSGIGTVFFIVVCASQSQTIKYIFTIFAFGSIYGCSPLILMWVANVIASPAEKRAICIAFVNSLGNMSSIYGVFLWPSKDAPRYIAGFSATTIWMGLICVVSLAAGYMFKRFPGKGDDTQGIAITAAKQHQNHIEAADWKAV